MGRDEKFRLEFSDSELIDVENESTLDIGQNVTLSLEGQILATGCWFDGSWGLSDINGLMFCEDNSPVIAAVKIIANIL